MTEGIPVNLVEFSDNRPVLDMLLSRPLGLLALLDEESRFPRATDRSFIRTYALNETIHCASFHSLFMPPHLLYTYFRLHTFDSYGFCVYTVYTMCCTTYKPMASFCC